MLKRGDCFSVEQSKKLRKVSGKQAILTRAIALTAKAWIENRCFHILYVFFVF